MLSGIRVTPLAALVAVTLAVVPNAGAHGPADAQQGKERVAAKEARADTLQRRHTRAHAQVRYHRARRDWPMVRHRKATARKAHRQLVARLDPWVRAWRRMASADRAWALRTAQCESGNRPVNTGNGYLSRFQWLLSTWHAAGGSGSPVNATFHEEAVRAVRWRNRAGWQQWPVCGR